MLLIMLAGCSDNGLSVVTPEPPAAEPTRALQVDPAAVDIVGLAPSEPWTGAIVWTNVGEASLTAEEVSVEGAGWELNLTVLPVELTPGTSLVGELSFVGDQPGTWTGSVTLDARTDAGPSLTVPLAATVDDGASGETGADTDDTDTAGVDTGEQVAEGCGSTAPFGLSVVGRFDVPGTAQIAVDVAGRRLFVPYEYGGEATGVYDLDTFARLDVLPAGTMPDPVLFDDLGGYVFVGNKGSATLSVYDSTTLGTSATLNIVDPQHMVLDRDLGLVYVASMSAGEVRALDEGTLAEVGTLPLDAWLRQGAYAHGTAVFPSTSGRLHVIDTASFTEVAVVDLGEQLFGSALVPEADRIFVSGWDTGTVYVLEASTLRLVTTLPMSAPYQMATDHDRCLVAIAGYGDDHLRIVDATTDTVISDAEVCSAPMDVAFDAATKRWFVACYGSDEIVVVEES